MIDEAHLSYLSKIVDEILDISCLCPSVISSVKNILDHKGCSGDIIDIDDVVDTIGYQPPIGKHICQLTPVQRNLDNDFFLVSQLEQSEKNSEISNFISKKINYSDLRAQLLEDIINGLGLKSMAYEDKTNYSLTSHDHDEIYNRVEWKSNPLYDNLKKSTLSNLGQVIVDFETLSSTDVSSNPRFSNVSSSMDNIYCPKFHIPLPPRPLIGTLKFIASPTINKLIELNQLSISEYDNILNVNPYDSDGQIRNDYDGWMFPNGAVIPNIDGQLSDAAKIFANSATAEEFTLPSISNFIRAFSQEGYLDSHLSVFPNQVGLKSHQHTIDKLKFTFSTATLDQRTKKIWTTPGNGGTEWIHQGGDGTENIVDVKNVTVNLGTKALNRIKTTQVSSDSQEPYPTHNLLPLMIYIGGESLTYYENQWYLN